MNLIAIRNLNDIWSIIDPEDWKRKNLSLLQPYFIASKNSIQKKVDEFVKAKDELIAEVSRLESIVHTEIFPKFMSGDIAQVLLWIETVRGGMCSSYRKSTRKKYLRPICSVRQRKNKCAQKVQRRGAK